MIQLVNNNSEDNHFKIFQRLLKEADEVIIWEELYNPIVIPGTKRIEQDKLVLRVAVTRSRKLTSFLTPAGQPCILL
jgi:hypothetical protein